MLIPLLHRIIRRRLARQGIRSERIYVRNTDLHYYEAVPESPKATILLVHGLGTSASTWVRLLPTLAREYHVLAPDLPGFGFSPPLQGSAPPTIDALTETLEGFVGEKKQIGPFVLVGHSLGGWITMKYALRHAHRVSRLILMNTAGIQYAGVEKARNLFDIQSVRETRTLLDHLWKRYPWYLRPFTRFVFKDLARRKVPEIVRTIEEQDFVNADLPRLTMPVRIIWGLGDRVIGPETLEILANRLPHRDIHTIEESGHVPQLETPQKLFRILRSVLPES